MDCQYLNTARLVLNALLATPSSCLANEFYTSFPTPKLVYVAIITDTGRLARSRGLFSSGIG